MSSLTSIELAPTVIQIQDPAQNLYESSIELSKSSHHRAEIFKYMNVAVNIGIIVSGAVITVSSSVDDPDLAKWMGIGLGLMITVGKSISSIFSLESKAVMLKQVSTQARIVSRDVGELLVQKEHDENYRRELARCYRRFDELDIQAFNATTATPVQRRQNGRNGSPTNSSTPTP